MTLGHRSGLVGRRRELALLRTQLDQARRGHGGVVFMCGEPGIGKTRLAAEVVEAARASGVTAVWGRCREDGSAPPYWPWVQVTRAVLRQSPAAASLGGASEDLAVLLEPDPSGSGSAFRLYEAVAMVLRAGADPDGLLVVLDDLHRADDPSLALLGYLTDELHDTPVLVLAATGTPILRMTIACSV